MIISIAMATYNGAKYLPDQLNSIARQTRLPDEIVVCDDGSTDKSVDIVDEFARVAPFSVRIVCNDRNQGHERSFERAIGECRGDIVFLCDQDDWWLETKIEVVATIFEDRPDVGVVIHDLDVTDANLVPIGETIMSQIRKGGMSSRNNRTFVIGCATAFRNELSTILLPIPPLKYGHDRWIHAVAHALGIRHVLGCSLQLHRRHGANASAWLFDQNANAGFLGTLQWSIDLDMRDAYRNQRQVLRTVEERIRGAAGRIRTTRPIDHIISDLQHAQRAYDNRLLLLDCSWWRRKVEALKMLSRGDYDFFLGWRSFAKDLIR